MLNIKKHSRAILASVAIIAAPVALSGCAMFGLADSKAETFRDRLVQAEVAFNTLLTRALAYGEAGKLSSNQIETLDDLFTLAATTLDAANEMERAGDMDEAQRKLTMFQTFMTEAALVLAKSDNLVEI